MINNKNKIDGWTFVIDRIESNSRDGVVHGWFMYFRLDVTQTENGPMENLFTHYLTPYKTPAAIKIPRFLFEKESETGSRVTNYEIGPKEIYEGLRNLFSTAYGDIPTPRTDLAMHRIPPSKRKEVEELLSAYEQY